MNIYPLTLFADTSSQVQTMDSREIAELTGKNHADVCRDIRNMVERLEMPESRFASGYPDAQGQRRTCYKLPYRETMILVSGYSVELRARVVDRWMELERQVAQATAQAAQVEALAEFDIPKDYPSALRRLADLTEKHDELQLEAEALACQVDQDESTIAELEPKAALCDRPIDAHGSRTLQEVGKINGLGPGRIFEILGRQGIIYKAKEGWLPYQQHIDSGRFEVRRTVYTGDDGVDHPSARIFVTGKGEAWIAAQLCFRPTTHETPPGKGRRVKAVIGECGQAQDMRATLGRWRPAAEAKMTVAGKGEART